MGSPEGISPKGDPTPGSSPKGIPPKRSPKRIHHRDLPKCNPPKGISPKGTPLSNLPQQGSPQQGSLQASRHPLTFELRCNMRDTRMACAKGLRACGAGMRTGCACRKDSSSSHASRCKHRTYPNSVYMLCYVVFHRCRTFTTLTLIESRRYRNDT